MLERGLCSDPNERIKSSSLTSDLKKNIFPSILKTFTCSKLYAQSTKKADFTGIRKRILTEPKLVYILCLLLIPFQLHAASTRVFLSGEGINAYDLLLFYQVNVLAKSGNAYDLGELEVMIYDGEGLRNFSIRWYDYVLDCIVPYHSVLCSGGSILLMLTKPGFLGTWKRMIWLSKLKDYKAFKSPEMLKLAKEKGYEIYEIPQNARAILESIRKDDPLKNAMRSHLRKMSLWDKVLRLILILLIAGALIAYSEKVPKFLKYPLIVIAILLSVAVVVA